MTHQNYIHGFNEVFYYIHNFESVSTPYGYVPQVLAKAKFTCSNEHIIEKWLHYTSTTHDPAMAFIQLYAAMDNENRCIMLDWIFENYKSGSSL